VSDSFYERFPQEVRDTQGRLTEISVLGGAGVTTTTYDAADMYDWNVRTSEMPIVEKHDRAAGPYLTTGSPVRTTTLYDAGGRDEWVGGTSTPAQYHRYDPGGVLVEHSTTIWRGGEQVVTHYDPTSGQVAQEQTVRDAGGTSGIYSYSYRYVAAETDYDLSGHQPWTSFTRNYVPTPPNGLTVPEGHLLQGTVAQMDDGSAVTTSYDSAGRIDYTFTAVQGGTGTLVTEATDHDLANEHPWSSFTVHQSASLGYAYVTGTDTVMDDGSVVTMTNLIDWPHGQPFKFGEHTTVTDAQGRLDYVLDTQGFSTTPGHDNLFTLRALDYDATTGKLDYEVIHYTDGTRDAVDFNATTGLADYAVATYTDGRIVARDFDAAGRLDTVVTTYASGTVVAQDYDAPTGLLISDLRTDPGGHTVSQAYDAAGRLDYGVERFADGRMTATDYDQADTQPWTSFSISYDALGNIQSTSYT
jgi:hypothetical protein